MLAVLRLAVYLVLTFIVVTCGDTRQTGSPADALLADADAVSRKITVCRNLRRLLP